MRAASLRCLIFFQMVLALGLLSGAANAAGKIKRIEGKIDFSSSNFPGFIKLTTIGKTGIEKGFLKSYKTNGTSEIRITPPAQAFSISFDCGFGVAYWGANCAVILVLESGDTVEFQYGNKEHTLGKGNFAWFGDVKNRKKISEEGKASNVLAISRRLPEGNNIPPLEATLYKHWSNDIVYEKRINLTSNGKNVYARVKEIVIRGHNTTSPDVTFIYDLSYLFLKQ